MTKQSPKLVNSLFPLTVELVAEESITNAETSAVVLTPMMLSATVDCSPLTYTPSIPALPPGAHSMLLELMVAETPLNEHAVSHAPTRLVKIRVLLQNLVLETPVTSLYIATVATGT